MLLQTMQTLSNFQKMEKGKSLPIQKDANERFNVRPQFVTFSNEPPNTGVSEENKIENVGSGFIFTSQLSKEPPKYNNTYTFAGQTNISISPSSIPNPNPSTLGMKIDQSFQPYGPYLFPIQNFPGYQAMYPSVVPLSQISNTQDNLIRVSTSVQQNQTNIPISIHNDGDKSESNIVNLSIVETEKPKDVEAHQTNVGTIVKDNPLGITKDTRTINPEFTNLNTKTTPLKVDKQTGPGANSYVKILKTPEMLPSTITNTTTTTNSFNTNNGSFTLKTSIPISKIDMRSIQPPVDNAIRNKPIVEVIETKTNETQSSIQLPGREQSKQLESQINIKNDLKQNFFHQGNAVVHPHNIIKMLVPSQSSDIQTHADNISNRGKPQIISDILLKPFDHKSNENLVETFVGANPRNLPIAINNPNTSINVRNETEKLSPKTDPQVRSNMENAQIDINKDKKKQYVFIPNPHMANKLLLSISSKQASSAILLPKSQPPEDGRMAIPFVTPQLPERLKDSNVTEPLPDPNSKVVALKRLHHENYDENDFENLITENQIYGNKIVIKEKSHPVFIHPASVMPNQGKVVKSETGNNGKDLNPKANLVVQPNYLYVSNVKFQPNTSNFMVINNNNQQVMNNQPVYNHNNNELKTEAINQATSQNKVMFGTQTFRTVNPITHTVSQVKTTNIVEANKQGTVLQTLLSKPNIKLNEANQGTKAGGQKLIGQIMNNKIVYQVPMIIDRNNVTNRAVNVVKPTYLNSELAMLLTKTKNEQLDQSTMKSDVDIKYDTIKNNESFNDVNDDKSSGMLCEEVSALDLAEKRKILRDNRRLLLSKNSADDGKVSGCKEKEKYLSSQHYYYEEETDDSEDMSEDEDLVSNANKSSHIPLETGEGKLEFLNMFGLTTKQVKEEKELDKLERSIHMDLVTLASVAARADQMSTQLNKMDSVKYGEQPFSLPVPMITENPINNDSKDKITDKIVFMNELKLGMVPHSYKIEHEMMWQHILRDRKKRNGESSLTDYLEKTFKAQNFSNFVNNNNIPIDLHTRDQLEIMTKIKQSVLENNNLIKLKLDKLNQTNESDNDIPFLAEKNFSEIQKLSYMANKSLTILRITQDIKDALCATKQPTQVNLTDLQQRHIIFPYQHDASQLNIPKIVSLKSTETQCSNHNIDISPATSMDEPRSSAGGVNHFDISDKYIAEDSNSMSDIQMTETQNTENTVINNSTDVKPPTATNKYQWPGIDAVLEAYRIYSTECDIEKQRLIEKNESLRNELALRENDAGCVGAHLRLLLTEQQVCESQKQSLQRSIEILTTCISQILA